MKVFFKKSSFSRQFVKFFFSTSST